MADPWAQAASILGGRCTEADHLSATLDDFLVEVSSAEESFTSAAGSMAAGTGSYRQVPCTTASVAWDSGPELKFDVLLRANRWRGQPVTFSTFLPMKLDDHLWARCPPWRRGAVRRYLRDSSRIQALSRLFDRIGELGPEDKPPASMVEVRGTHLIVFAPAELTTADEITELARAAVALARALSRSSMPN